VRLARRNRIASSRCAGAVLFISLVVLLALTLLGVSGVQTATLELRMARNQHDYALALQAAESALREGEHWLASAGQSAAFSQVGVNGLWTVAPLGERSRWELPGVWGDGRSVASPSPVVSLSAAEPRYLVEHLESVAALGSDGSVDESAAPAKVFRVTARGVGATDGAVVLLQSTFAPAFGRLSWSELPVPG
tara:strand:+ start:2405 stop:2983 length:579 start_codon:yes stop_codon:yes gene_type:complete